ncbi:MAG: hypothetical protein HOU81_27850 [Hamadaea sp.]|uniref:M4 family metallopeptidase n=1 Tax=Hamadaea sp. TaxID=2024425 RepID=UPI0018087E5D|nr:M4 family metallopeptidase [Hamadaea sp.]NUR74638.1 hypothetical protein [Hamadaea sp.]NUT21152.1 hypothetical protein [Hamadaea sp.]
MRTRTRVALLAAGVALAGVAVAAAVPDDAPVATLSPAAPAASSTEDPAAADGTSASATSTDGGQRNQTPPKGSVSAAAGIRELRTASNGKSTVVVAADGAVSAATAASGKSLTTAGPDAFATRYAAAFGLTAAHSLAKTQSEALPGGDTVNRYQQTAGGLPILGGQLVVTSHGKQVRSAIGETSGRTPVSTKATVSAATAAATALSAAAADTGLTAELLKAGTPHLALYDPTLLGAPGAASLRPTWQVEITATGGGEVATVLVDALDGKARLTMSERQSARSRTVCDLGGRGVDTGNQAAYRCTPSTALGLQATTRRENGPASSVADVNRAYEMLGATYDFYKKNFGIDSFDGRGAPLQATVRVCDIAECPFENAFWEGTQFVFGSGYAVDDVVAHEYTHAITEWSSHLMYAYQPGAINEALSDIMGEFVDQQYVAANEASPSLKWQLGEDLPTGVYVKPPLRSMDNPGLRGQPQAVGGSYWYTGSADSGGVHTNSGVANYAAYLIAGGPNGIGNAKSAQLWWRVMHMLPSAAGYQTLGATLRSACLQLVGQFGFTGSECAVVDAAVATTAMAASANDNLGALCPSAGQPYDTAYFDGFEQAGTWTLSNSSTWLNVPSTAAAYQYAAHGNGSLNGWTPSNTGDGSTATMPTAVTAPSGGYLYFAHSTLDASSLAGVDLQVSVGDGAWTAAPILGGSAAGRLAQRPGFVGERVDLSAYAGQQVRFRFVLRTASSTNSFDWYADDFRIYSCAQRPSAPTGYAYLDGTTALIGGLTTAFIPSGQQIASYEVSYSRDIAGAPTTIPASSPSTAVQVQVPGAGSTPMQVKVRTVTNLGTTGDWTTLWLGIPPVSCQQAAYPLFIGRGPQGCPPRPLPRRN